MLQRPSVDRFDHRILVNVKKVDFTYVLIEYTDWVFSLTKRVNSFI